MEVFPDNFTTRWCICAQQKVLQQETISLMINNVVGFDSSASKTAALPFEQHLSWQNVWSNPMCKHRLQQKNKHERIVYVYHRHALW
jgi:hypothetical protein